MDPPAERRNDATGEHRCDGVRLSAHEQRDQDDDRNRYAEQPEQQ
jgi:hypothetical protein